MSSRVKISAIMHLPKPLPYPIDTFFLILEHLLNQQDHKMEILILDEQQDNNIKSRLEKCDNRQHVIHPLIKKSNRLGQWLNSALAKAKGDYLLYINNQTAEVYLKRSAANAFLFAAERHPDWGLIYADYQLQTENKKIEEINLLQPHKGRLRDNQDFGYLFLFNTAILKQCGGFDTSLKFHSIFDTRLIVSEKAAIIHIGNKRAGALYRVATQKAKHDVFDYLLSSRESQLEAEQVLTAHLKRTGAYLAPGAHQRKRPDTVESELKASVIIPVNNRPEFIGLAIESAMRQTIQDIEIIVVVNGGAEDPTVHEVQKYQNGGEKFVPGKPEVHLVIIDINNIGLSLNCGVKAAKGIYYIQLDSDDRLKSTAIEKIIHVFESDTKVGMVIGSYEVWELNKKTGAIKRRKDIPVVTHDEWTEVNGRNNLLRINGAGAPRAIPIAIIKEMGYFGMNDAPFSRNYGEDYDMVLKISEKYRIGRVWDPIYDVIRHAGSTDHSIDQRTIDRNDEAKDYMRLQAVKRRQTINQKSSAGGILTGRNTGDRTG
jgi:glycosyltransferase involved in cell wall biosynthesis